VDAPQRPGNVARQEEYGGTAAQADQAAAASSQP